MNRVVILFGLLFSLTAVAQAASKPHYNARGNLLIVDSDNDRVIEIDATTHTIVWQYQRSVSRTVTNWVVGPSDAERFHGQTLITARGVLPGMDPRYPDGYVDSRVFEVNRQGKIHWQYGQTGVAGAGPNQLNQPAAAVYSAHTSVLIADQGNHRILHLRRRGRGAILIFQYGTTGVSGSGSNQLNRPASVQRLGNGDYLIADTGNDRVVQVNRHFQIVWQYGSPGDTATLNAPTYACRLSGSKYLITDSGNNRILVVDQAGSTLFAFATSSRPGSVAVPQPARAVLLKNGNYLIADQFNHQVIEVSAAGDVVWTYGTIGVPGSDPGLLNAPCDAKGVNEFTGLTAPTGGGSGGGSGIPGSPF